MGGGRNYDYRYPINLLHSTNRNKTLEFLLLFPSYYPSSWRPYKKKHTTKKLKEWLAARNIIYAIIFLSYICMYLCNIYLLPLLFMSAITNNSLEVLFFSKTAWALKNPTHPLFYIQEGCVPFFFIPKP